MARYTGPNNKLFRNKKVKDLSNRKLTSSMRQTASGQHGAVRKKLSEYALHLAEKQKIRFTYLVSEKQFAKYYTEKKKKKGVTGTILLQLLESRLDNILFRAGLGITRKQTRQIVNHGLITVNGKRVNIPSYIVKAGDIIAIKESKQSNEQFKDLKGSKIVMPKWVEFDTNTLSGKILALPSREDIDADIKEQLIVELYSR